MEKPQSEFSKAGVTLCKNCVHPTGLGYWDYCKGTEKKTEPNYATGGNVELHFRPKWGDYSESLPFTREVNTDGKCRYFKERPAEPESKKSKFLLGLRHFYQPMS